MGIGKFVGLAMGLLVATTGAQAQVEVAAEKGYWSLSMGATDNGEAVCIISTGGVDGNAGWTFSLRYFQTSPDIQVWFLKDNWQIPSDITSRIGIEFDRMGPWSLETYAHADGDILWGLIPNGNEELFFHEMTTSSNAVVIFEGSEAPWRLTMDGAAAIAPRFLNCKDALDSVPATPTQPFSNSTTPDATQPFVRS